MIFVVVGINALVYVPKTRHSIFATIKFFLWEYKEAKTNKGNKLH